MSAHYLDNLRDAVAALHGCDSSHTGTARVIERFQGRTVFNGPVEVFALIGHTSAQEAYAWAYHDGKETRYVVVLRSPPVNDPSDAIKAAIASGAFR